jgi:hypothetical protein
VISASRFVRKTGAPPVLGLTPSKSAAESASKRSPLFQFRGVVQVKRTAGVFEPCRFPAKHQRAELETRIDVGEIAAVGVIAILEIEQRRQPPAAGD